MKKKYIRSLNSMQTWLKKQDLLTEEIENALRSVALVIEQASEDLIVTDKAELPLPEEIQGGPHALALYSDGGCRGNPGPGAYAFVVQNQTGEILGEGVQFEAYTTNNRMELLGCIRGLSEIVELLKRLNHEVKTTKIKVMTDSKYVVDGMKSWVQGWKNRGWKKADNKAPENLRLWQELDQLRDLFMEIDWVWVKGHGGHPQNEYCDRRVNEAMDENLG